VRVYLLSIAGVSSQPACCSTRSHSTPSAGGDQGQRRRRQLPRAREDRRRVRVPRWPPPAPPLPSAKAAAIANNARDVRDIFTASASAFPPVLASFMVAPPPSGQRAPCDRGSGERGVVQRWAGRRERSRSGLHLHWPAPIRRGFVIDVEGVRQLSGFAAAPRRSPPSGDNRSSSPPAGRRRPLGRLWRVADPRVSHSDSTGPRSAPGARPRAVVAGRTISSIADGRLAVSAPTGRADRGSAWPRLRVLDAACSTCAAASVHGAPGVASASRIARPNCTTPWLRQASCRGRASRRHQAARQGESCGAAGRGTAGAFAGSRSRRPTSPGGASSRALQRTLPARSGFLLPAGRRRRSLGGRRRTPPYAAGPPPARDQGRTLYAMKTLPPVAAVASPLFAVATA
jgi:hypothetical protein